ncbi:MAG: glycoside hydrolase family 16 protein [Succinivibrio sp.]
MLEDFNGDKLNHKLWLETYLPQWSSAQKTVPSYRIGDSILTLYIADDQKPWSEEFNGCIRVSNLQTGVYSGPVGSTLGQHHFSDNLVVRQEHKPMFLWTPFRGRIEMKCRAHISKENVAALWLIGREMNPHESAELCLFELKGSNILSREKAVVGYGIRSFADPCLENAFFEDCLSIDVEQWNVFSLDWREDSVSFYVNGSLIRTVNQAPAYPMQIMLNLYDLENIKNENNTFEIDYIRTE